jgi:hypothetical protein
LQLIFDNYKKHFYKRELINGEIDEKEFDSGFGWYSPRQRFYV